MNEMQMQAIENLNKKNAKFMLDIDSLSVEIEEAYKQHDHIETGFWSIINKMGKASSNLPYMPYCYAYAIIGNEFIKAVSPCIKDSFYGTMNSDYQMLSDGFMAEFEEKMDTQVEALKSTLNTYIDKIAKLLDEIAASNSITRRLSGIDDKLIEIENFKKMLWYPKELSKQEYSIKGSFSPPAMLSMQQFQFRYPFHIEMILKYDYIFKTKALHLNMLRQLHGILMYINEFLPFAELIPLKEHQGLTLNNIISPKQIQVGSENTFDGDIKIGNEGELKNGN